MKYLSVGTNAKTAKSDKGGEYLTAILYLSPATLSGRNLCPWASKGCAAACLNTAGRGAFGNVQQARMKKTLAFINDRAQFIADLRADIAEHVRKCAKLGVKPAVRLNGTSDILWEKIAPELFSAFPQVQFYDYTAAPVAFRAKRPTNYHLTKSRKEYTTDAEIISAVNAGMNVSVVFDRIPDTYLGIPVVNGDQTDLRFLDPVGVIVGLTAKGKAKRDASGFVVQAFAAQVKEAA